MMARSVALGTVLVLGLSGCAGASAAKAKAASDLSCPESKLSVTEGEMGSYTVKGCGKKASYVVRAGEAMAEEGGSSFPELGGPGMAGMGD